MRRAILLVAFGASSIQGRQALRAFDALVRARFDGWSVRWAFTSDLLRERLTQERQKSDSVRKALRRLGLERFGRVALQPLQVIAGAEHEEVCAAAAEVGADLSLDCRVGAPLLDGPDDVAETAAALLRHLPGERRPDEDVVLMGHGARHAAAERYDELAGALQRHDARLHVGTMSGSAGLDALLPRLASARVWLLPLLSIIGRHALRDMAGDSAWSWRARIEAAGHSCVPVLRGMAEYTGLAELWLRHLETAAES